MKYGFVKAQACAPALRLGQPQYNADVMIQTIRESEAEILVFPELSVCGATCGDLFLQKNFTDSCFAQLLRVARATENNAKLVFVGAPVCCAGKLYNCAAALSMGRIVCFVPKSEISFDEARYFSPAPDCEVHFEREGEEYCICPSALFLEQDFPELAVGCAVGESACDALIVARLTAQFEYAGVHQERKTALSAYTRNRACAVVCANAGSYESCGDAMYAGGHLIYENGERLDEAKPFSQENAQAEIDAGYLLHERQRRKIVGTGRVFPLSFIGGRTPSRAFSQTPFVPKKKEQFESILLIQAQALKKRLTECTAQKRSVLGVSGGLDSTLALLVCVRACALMGVSNKNVFAYTMPAFGTSKKTKSNALTLMEELGVTANTIPIADAVRVHFQDIGHDESVRNSAYENAQARYRTMVLMDIANDVGGLVVGTGDMSELALGWCTYNGDHMSNYAVNCGVPKTLVKSLVAYEAERLGGKIGATISDILKTEISPELLPPDENGKISQKTEELVGNYDLNDFILYHFLQRGASPTKIFALAHNAFGKIYHDEKIKSTLKNFFTRFFSQQFKRSCSPDGVQVGEFSLSPRGGLVMPSDMSAQLWLEEIERI